MKNVKDNKNKYSYENFFPHREKGIDDIKIERDTELNIANEAVLYLNSEKADREAELFIANKELFFSK